MKRIFHIIYILICAIVFCGCANDDFEALIADEPSWISMIEILASVSDSYGNDLLNPSVSGHVDIDNVKVEFMGKTYSINHSDTPQEISRVTAFQPMIVGSNQRYYIYFGQYDVEHDYHGERIVITWEDGKQDIITFDFERSKFKHDNYPTFYLNGEPHNGFIYEFRR